MQNRPFLTKKGYKSVENSLTINYSKLTINSVHRAIVDHSISSDWKKFAKNSEKIVLSLDLIHIFTKKGQNDQKTFPGTGFSP